MTARDERLRRIARELQGLASTYTRARGENGDRVADLLTQDAYRLGGEILAVLDEPLHQIPLLRFGFRRIASDLEGYYHDRWDLAVPVEVFAVDEAEARRKAKAMSGDPPRGRFWKFSLDRVTELS